MPYPPDHRDSMRDTSLDHDRRIVNGSMLALAAFVVVATGIVWYALTDDHARIAAIKQPTIERAVPNSTTGFGGAPPHAPAPAPSAR